MADRKTLNIKTKQNNFVIEFIKIFPQKTQFATQKIRLCLILEIIVEMTWQHEMSLIIIVYVILRVGTVLLPFSNEHEF